MADKDLEADDPYELVAHRAPLQSGSDPDELVARCFVEEFALMGVPASRILHLFRSEFFVGTHAILEERGEPFVQRIINSVFGKAPGETPGKDIPLAPPIVAPSPPGERAAAGEHAPGKEA